MPRAPRTSTGSALVAGLLISRVESVVSAMRTLRDLVPLRHVSLLMAFQSGYCTPGQIMSAIAVNPLGIKGVGEIGIVGVNAAIADPAHHATGRRIRKLPIRIEDLL